MSELDEAKRWLAQAAVDLKTAEDNIQLHPYAACFFSQQAAEKAVKAFSIAESGTYPRAHDIMGALKALPALQDLIPMQDAILLDSFYIGTRYPDAWPGGTPAERFSQEQAQEAFQRASNIVGVCAQLLAEFERAAGEPPGDETR
ncbi:MAG: HEPN domain-containing protein [Firmicutes bacterium]|nr:HEPN domain-containing protein [Bacillota bacterium]